MPKMLKAYPDLFEQIDKQKLHQEVSLPAVSLKLKGGFDSLDNPDFVKATRLVHNSVMAGWKEFSIFIRDLVKIKSRTEDKKQIDRRIDEYVKVHPWAKKYRQRFFSLARIIKVDRRRVPDRADWLHKGFNFTQGVVQWREEPAIFFVDIGADVKTGVQSVRVHSIRESHELTQPKVEERMQFRTRLIKNLRERDSRLEIGPEGKYTLQTFKENP